MLFDGMIVCVVLPQLIRWITRALVSPISTVVSSSCSRNTITLTPSFRKRRLNNFDVVDGVGIVMYIVVNHSVLELRSYRGDTMILRNMSITAEIKFS